MSFLATRFGLAIQSVSDSRRAANLTEKQDLHLEFAAFGPDLEELAHMNTARRLDRLPVRLNAAEFTSSRGYAACLEKPRRPKPFIDANARQITLRHTLT